MKRMLTIIITAAVLLTACSENNPTGSNPARGDVASVSDRQMFEDYIEYHAQRWSEILAGLEQDTSLLGSIRSDSCTALRGKPCRLSK